MSLWRRTASARRGDEAGPLALPPVSTNQRAIDALLTELHQLHGERESLIESTSASEPEGGDAVRAGYAVLVVHLRRSDRTRALAGAAAARQAIDIIRERLEDLLLPRDRFALIGVDELLLFLPDVDSTGRALLVANRLVRKLEEPVRHAGAEMRARPAIGCALFPAHGRDPEALIAAADHAARAARLSAEGYRIAEGSTRAHQDADLANQLHAALQGNQLVVHLQPQLDLHTRRFDAAEALIRWPRAEPLPPVSPLKVVELAEAQGLMPALTLFVLNTVLRQSASFAERGIDMRIAINVSASMLTDTDLPGTVQQALDLWGVPAHKLTLEVTEATLMQDVEASIATMHALKRLGTRLSLDDFGTGYSSFAYLRRMPLDELKIDQLFVRHLGTSPDGAIDPQREGDLRIVRSIIDIAHNFELETVVEGVEDQATLELLEGLGCDVIQGYHTCRPMPIDRIEGWWRGVNA